MEADIFVETRDLSSCTITHSLTRRTISQSSYRRSNTRMPSGAQRNTPDPVLYMGMNKARVRYTGLYIAFWREIGRRYMRSKTFSHSPLNRCSKDSCMRAHAQHESLHICCPHHIIVINLASFAHAQNVQAVAKPKSGGHNKNLKFIIEQTVVNQWFQQYFAKLCLLSSLSCPQSSFNDSYKGKVSCFNAYTM